ncbi:MULTISPECIES: RluA family pseudouridine synthase [unclassified Vibrio]|uniref:RluA family pseudouridine synthase n=1 Tax=Vibrio sp. HB236076 TaxID=3232307 RepID=A0AB39HK22_9VIBR|nr:RluA family pseudouridine synthase [Vibrio sp. HB161653]MDP5252574.1 RluA family pseudouridine synthase [Vibrio sp. HB161653]
MSVVSPYFTALEPMDSELPSQFTFPFFYQPHPLAVQAANDLKARRLKAPAWNQTENQNGKMFGVLVVISPTGQVGYLAAFSGKIDDQNHWPGFVPPVFDLLEHDDFYRTKRQRIQNLSDELATWQRQQKPELERLTQQLEQQTQYWQTKITDQQALNAQRRAQRKQARQDAQSRLNGRELTHYLNELGQQSVDDKRAVSQLKAQRDQSLATLNQAIKAINDELIGKEQQRAHASLLLQKDIFAQYHFLNAEGESQDLLAIFSETKTPIPPAGAGECAAPKLLQWAYQHHYTPVALAEFWWGSSPKSEIRKHEHYYPSCQSKCLPILTHMLKGLNVEDDPLKKNPAENKSFEIIYQDEAIVVVNKPADFLSVPGRHIKDSVFTRLQQQFPNAEGPFVIHRLDMATSGLLIFALTKRANRNLQKQFITRKVKKTYWARVQGPLSTQSGEIHLPLTADLYDSPRQKVCEEQGKAAHTEWHVIEQTEAYTLLTLIPHTGRTHQLRVHCAHHKGLNTPIIGDDLYGKPAQRLFLHAGQLELLHPYTHQAMTFNAPCSFYTP